MEIRTLKDIPELKGKKVLLRVDFNVPTKEDGEIQDDTRITESLPTIKVLMEAKAKIIIMTHLGRPKGVDESLRLNKVAAHLEKLIGKKVTKLNESIGENVKKAIEKMHNGDILMLENIRFHHEEEECEENFTKELSELGDIFVNDAFGTAHRKHASTAGLASYLPAYGGILIEKEIDYLAPLLSDNFARPLTMIFGGAKIDTKIEVIKNFLPKADYFLIGGGIANTFLYAQNKDIGESLFESDKAFVAKEIASKFKDKTDKLLIPTDVVVSEEISENAKGEVKSVDDVQGKMKILDIGPESIEAYKEVIAKSRTIIWNGPVGLYEIKAFENGTKEIATAITASHCTSIIGGGDTADCVKRFGFSSDDFSHISTGGGACIEFLGGKMLPGIAVLIKAEETQEEAPQDN